MQLEVIILSPEMRENSPTTISDFKISQRLKPPDSVKKWKGQGSEGKRGDWGVEERREGRGGRHGRPHIGENGVS